LQAEAGLARLAIVDCDVHQGNGTAAIFAADDAVFTFSMHGARNFPFVKEASDLDIELADGTVDDEYLWHLERGLARRDEHVLATLHARGVPVVLAMAGGYAHDIEESVAIHANTLRTARRVWES